MPLSDIVYGFSLVSQSSTECMSLILMTSIINLYGTAYECLASMEKSGCYITTFRQPNFKMLHYILL